MKDLNPAITPKRQLGQVFLTDKNIVRKIISACGITAEDRILEIGPGPGTLTGYLSDMAKEVIAVETDGRFCQKLTQDFEGKNVKIVHTDFLKYDLRALPNNLIVVANLPYYISSPIMEILIENRSHFTSLFLTVQLEFGRRMAASPHSKDYSSLSCFVQYYTNPKILFKISNAAFKPRPKVDSCFMHLAIRPQPQFKAKDEAFLFRLIQNAFQRRRKTLPNAFEPIINKEKLASILANLKLKAQLRPENLTIQDFVNIANQAIG